MIFMDGLSYSIEERDGISVAVGTWSPEGGEPIYFETPFVDEATLSEQVLSLQSFYARLRD